jgi:hypothetical protein
MCWLCPGNDNVGHEHMLIGSVRKHAVREESCVRDHRLNTYASKPATAMTMLLLRPTRMLSLAVLVVALLVVVAVACVCAVLAAEANNREIPF